MTTKILIIGATSLVGRRLGEIAPEVTFTTRKLKRENEMHLDLMHPTAFEGQGFAQVIATSPIWLITDAVLEVLWAQGMKRLVVFSSTSRFTKTFSPEPEERRVAEQLAAAEARLEPFCATRDVALTILRPTLIYDEGRDENVSRIAKFIDKNGFFPICGKASGLRQPVHARDLATAALQVLSSDTARNKAYDLSGAETLTYRDMVSRVFEANGLKARIIALPEWAWKLGFAGLNLIRPNTALKTNINMALRMNSDLVFDHTDATQDFGYAPGPFRPQFIQ